MKYTQEVSAYRAALFESLTKGERQPAKIKAIMLANALKSAANRTTEYLNAAKMINQAKLCECIAVMIERDGVTNQVIRIATNMENFSLSNATLPPSVPPLKKETPSETGNITKSSGGEGDWVADIFEKKLSATVVVSTQTASGTGFFISSNGYLLTNHHVVEMNEKSKGVYKTVHICSGDKKISCEATIIAYDKKRDVALLKVETENKKMPYIPIIKKYEDLRQGETVMVIGNGLSYGLAPIVGTVKFLRDKDYDDLVYTAPANPGDSGGPVLNKHGECVGINKALTKAAFRITGAIQVQGITRATPADEIAKLIKEWKEKYSIKF